ncbi:hypothetical protein BH10CYA1_BH10CYA1_55030 [soil metagenome]
MVQSRNLPLEIDVMAGGTSFPRTIINSLLHMGLVPKRLRASYLIHERTGGTVAAGPFFGMRYIEESVGSALYPKLLGTYEMELHAIIEKLCTQKYEYIIDVGAAEGYYAVGMAIRCPRAKIVAYESEQRGRSLLQKLAELNGDEEKIEIHGTCDLDILHQQLEKIGTSKTLIVMDVEGYEIDLLDPERVPGLKRCSMLVEIHDGRELGPIGKALEDRFKSSHRIESVWSRPRYRDDLPGKGSYIVDLRMQKMMDEGRLRGLSWFYLEVSPEAI